MSMVLPIVFELFVFFFVTTAIFLAAQLIERTLEQRRRLGHQSIGGGTMGMGDSLLQSTAVTGPVFQWIESSSSISDPAERQRLRRELALAGFERPSAPVWYVVIRFGLAIGLPLFFLLFNSVMPKPLAGLPLIFWSLTLCAFGMFVPAIFVSRRASSRRTELEFEFPDALDLMVVCVEAGLSLDSSLVRVGQEVEFTHPRISRELERTSEEIRAGRSRAEALRGMGDRTDVSAIRSFAALVIQSEQLGSSIAQTLRTYSTELRETRYIRAEEKALRVPVLMTIPLVTCILPVIVTALLLPPIIDLIRTVFPTLHGH